MLEDIDRSVEIEKGVQRISGRILTLILVANPVAQIGAAFQPLLQLQNPASQFGLVCVKFRVGIGL